MEYSIIPYEERKWTVYVHENKINGKKYVGITSKTNPNDRWRNGRGYDGSPQFYNAIRKYGWDNFNHIIVVNSVTKNEACNIEIMLISALNTRNSEYGYNFYIGGTAGVTGLKMSKESCDKKRGFQSSLSKPVVCLNDLNTYGSLNLAAQDKGIAHGHSIALCCDGITQYSGIDKSGTYLKWMWLSDYESSTNEHIKNRLTSPVYITNSNQIICLNNKKHSITQKRSPTIVV